MSTRLGRHAVTVLLVVVALAAILTLTTPNLPQAEAQARVTTVTVYVPVVQTVYVPVLQTVIQTVKVPVTYWNITTTGLTYWIITTVPIQIGPFSLDLSDAHGLRFLAFSGAVALAGLIVGGLVARARIH